MLFTVVNLAAVSGLGTTMVACVPFPAWLSDTEKLASSPPCSVPAK
jgi:hypothetical protein